MITDRYTLEMALIGCALEYNRIQEQINGVRAMIKLAALPENPDSTYTEWVVRTHSRLKRGKPSETSGRPGRRTGYTVSEKSRARMAAAQRKRWRLARKGK